MKVLFVLIAFLSANYVYSQIPQTAGMVTRQDQPKKVGTKIINGASCTVYQGIRGGLYIVRVSKKTGKEYRQYIKK